MIMVIEMPCRSIHPCSQRSKNFTESSGQKRIWTTIGLVQCSPTNRHSSDSEIPFDAGRKLRQNKSKESQRIGKRFTYGVPLASKVWSASIHSEEIWMVTISSTRLRVISSHAPLGVFGGDWRLHQDNDPKHRSGVAKEFIGEKIPNLLPWPLNSPNLNPIENYWNVLKRYIEKRKPENIDDLGEYMNEEMRKTTASFLINFITSMKDRCLAAIFSNGERIKFRLTLCRSAFLKLSNSV